MKSIKLTESEIQDFCIEYKDFELPTKNEYISHFFNIDGAYVSIFNSGKILFQGINLERFSKYLNHESEAEQLSLDLDEDADDTPYDYMNTIGADEVGTGDTFGPICCAAVFIKVSDIEYLKKLGIRDSKKISDDRIIKLGEIIKNKYKYKVNIVRNEIFNDKSNELNMNEMKAKLHDQNIKNLAKEVKYDAVCLDEFVNRDKYFSYLDSDAFKDIAFEMKGESKSIAVAAASILARYFFLLEFSRLEELYGYKLPKGSGKNVKLMIDKIREDGKEDIFYHIAKMSFKNFSEE